MKITSRRWVRHFSYDDYSPVDLTNNVLQALISWRRPYRFDGRPLPFRFGILEVCDYSESVPDQ